MSKASPLAQTPQPVEFEQLKGERFLFCPNVESEDLLSRANGAEEAQPIEIARFPQVWNVVNAVEQNIGVSYGPATTWVNSKTLDIAALPLKGAKKTSYLYLRKCKEQTPASEKFAEFLRLSLQAAEKRNRAPES